MNKIKIKVLFKRFANLLLQKEEIASGFRAMASERARWLMRPSHIVRAARHYEGAAQILIRHTVMSARKVQPAVCSIVLTFLSINFTDCSNYHMS